MTDVGRYYSEMYEEEMADEIRVGDWVEVVTDYAPLLKDPGFKGKVVGFDSRNGTLLVEKGNYNGWFMKHNLRKLSFSELPPEAWDEVQRDYNKEYDKLTEDQTIKGSYIDPLTNHKITWHMNTVEEEIKDKLKGLGWKPPEESASSRQHGGNHYKKYPIQPYHYCFVNKLNNLQSEAISYITRYKDKGGKQDLEKAIHTLELLIEAEYDDV